MYQLDIPLHLTSTSSPITTTQADKHAAPNSFCALATFCRGHHSINIWGCTEARVSYCTEVNHEISCSYYVMYSFSFPAEGMEYPIPPEPGNEFHHSFRCKVLLCSRFQWTTIYINLPVDKTRKGKREQAWVGQTELLLLGRNIEIQSARK